MFRTSVLNLNRLVLLFSTAILRTSCLEQDYTRSRADTSIPVASPSSVNSLESQGMQPTKPSKGISRCAAENNRLVSNEEVKTCYGQVLLACQMWVSRRFLMH